jgi:hypothetical protein
MSPRTNLLVPVFAFSIVAGCTSMKSMQAENTEALLKSAGFTPFAASSPDALEKLKGLEPLQLVRRSRDGKTFYTYADPNACKCLYVGDEKDYANFRKLLQGQSLEQEHAERLNAIEASDVEEETELPPEWWPY